MALAYTPPGVKVNEVVSPSVSPLLAVPASICLVGLAGPSASASSPGGVIQKTEAITLSGTTAVALSVPSDATMTSTSVKKVMHATQPELAPNGFTATTDYTFDATAKTIARVGAGAIPDGSTVYVTFTYTPADYFRAIRLANMADIEERFGSVWTSNGKGINSPLSHAAQMAFENGAQDVVLQPLFFNNAGTLQQPTDAQAAASSTWASNFVALRDIEDINVIVPVVGQSQTSVGDAEQLAIIQALQDHIYFMKSEQQQIVGIVGEDASASTAVAAKATLRTHATTLAGRYGGSCAENIVFVGPAKYARALPASGEIAVGGQYIAAALAGAVAAREVSASLTRKALSGIKSVVDYRTKAEKNEDAASGLCVIEQKGGTVQVRHAVTIDTTSTVKRELSIVRAKHRVIESVRDTIENQIIGEVIADGDAPLVVRNAIIGVLDGLKTNHDIVAFSDVQARTLSLDPTHIEVRFSYKPAFPVNYVTVTFALDLSSGDLSLPDTTEVNGTF